MKSTGIIRKIDDLGRLVLPIELRRSFGWEERDRIEILPEEDRIVLRKFEPVCCFCKGSKSLREFRGKLVCTDCIGKLSALDTEEAAGA